MHEIAAITGQRGFGQAILQPQGIAEGINLGEIGQCPVQRLSCASSQRFTSSRKPPPLRAKPPSFPSAAITRWQGTTSGKGLAPHACPTARGAVCKAGHVAIGARLVTRYGSDLRPDAALKSRSRGAQRQAVKLKSGSSDNQTIGARFQRPRRFSATPPDAAQDIQAHECRFRRSARRCKKPGVTTMASYKSPISPP